MYMLADSCTCDAHKINMITHMQLLYMDAAATAPISIETPALSAKNISPITAYSHAGHRHFTSSCTLLLSSPKQARTPLLLL
jgi:uncharacterized protein YcfL